MKIASGFVLRVNTNPSVTKHANSRQFLTGLQN